MDKITDLHQIHEEVLFTERGDGVAGIKRHRRDLSSDEVRDLVTASGRGRLKEDLESSTSRRRQDYNATPPTLEPYTQDDPSVNSVHGSGGSSSSFVVVTGESSSGHSTMKSAKIYPFTDVLGLYSARYTISSSISIGAVSVGSSTISFFNFRSPLEITFLHALLQSFEKWQ
ncbi:hypothetical protein Tco_0059792 [Tanacetum coccineum]